MGDSGGFMTLVVNVGGALFVAATIMLFWRARALECRSVRSAQGWAWIGEGWILFRKAPGLWLAFVLVLFIATKLLLRIPVLSIVFVLLMPIFIAGLMEGCRALDLGGALQPGHLVSGFRKDSSRLVTVGGYWLVGNIAVFVIVRHLGGDAIPELQKMMAQGTAITPQVAQEMQTAVRTVTRALLVGTLVSVPLTMAVVYAPMLVYFHDQGPFEAMKASFVACLKNALPMLVYGLAVLAGMFLITPFSMALGQYDLAVWVLAPIVLPSLYASYKDIFPAAPASQADRVAGPGV